MATRSVQSDRYFNGSPPSVPIAIWIMLPPAWPEEMRRSQASCELLNLPRLGGNVRVASWPNWWQPTHPMFFTHIRYSLRPLRSFEVSCSVGSFTIAYQ